MAEISPPPVSTQLIVFADDWGRHPSSSQHLIRELLPNYPTLWVNTVGTRRPRLNLADFRRALGKARAWAMTREATADTLPAGLTVISPPMYPGYRSAWQQQINDRSIARAVQKHRAPDVRTVVLTTLPTTAKLPEHLSADRWIYYCVDDYANWPGTDHRVMESMEQRLIERVDTAACVSETLLDRVAASGCDSSVLLTHGVDAAFWQQPRITTKLAKDWSVLDKPVALFWGLLDERMDRSWVVSLSRCEEVHAAFAGPMKIDPGHLFNADSLYLGSLAFDDLPAHAAAASVLVMPYIDAPVTRAMQPLKLLEYLATMKPVVVRDLPSTRPWSDCCDLAGDAEAFVRLVEQRAQTGTPPEQIEARLRRLASESWSAKAADLADLINAD